MADDTTIQTTPQAEAPKEASRAEERITQLSEKVRLEAEARQKAETAAADATRERDFFAGFSDVVANNPAAKDFKDEILSKVKSGYTVEDAAYAVLGRAGKLGTPTAQPVQQQVAGGSASTAMPQGGQKSPTDMTQAERRAELEKLLVWSE